MSHQTIIVLDFGSQYTQLIARRLRELSVYSEIWPPDTPADKIRARKPIGIILSGGPKSVSDAGAPKCDAAVFDVGTPVLGICYGMQLMAHTLGAHSSPARLQLDIADLDFKNESQRLGQFQSLTLLPIPNIDHFGVFAARVVSNRNHSCSSGPEGPEDVLQLIICCHQFPVSQRLVVRA